MTTQRFLLSANVLSLALFLSAACSPAEPGGSSGTGGTTGTGGSKPVGTGGAGSGGSPSSGTGGGVSGTGGSSGTGGNVVGTGGSSGTGGAQGTGGASGTGGSSGDAQPTDGAPPTEGGPPASGPLALMVTGLDMSPRFNVPVFPRSASNPMNMSPPIAWTGMPEGTKSFAVSMIDTGTTSGMNVTPGNGTKAHWVLFDIPTNVNMLPANLPHTVTLTNPPGSKTTRFAGGTGYFGPGAGSVNIYVITVWALKVAELGATAGASSQSVYGMLNAQSLGKASFVAVGKQNGL